MSEDTKIVYESRDSGGKSALSELRNTGMVPGVVYGGSEEPFLLSVDNRDILRHMKQGSFFSTIYELESKGSGGKGVRVLPRDVQMHPLKDSPWHVDFLRVSDQTILRVNVPVHFVNQEECPGLKAGGILNVVRHEVELVGKLGQMLSVLEIDLSGSELGDALKISKVTLPKGVKPTITNRDFTIANIAVPKLKEATAEVEVDEEEEEEE
jgi:large subunit ribosomal protein L25